jgi:hypothetical protein
MSTVPSDCHCHYITSFFDAIPSDPRISTTHISLYLALYVALAEQEFVPPVKIIIVQVLEHAKIGRGTYSKCINELHHWGYIRYVPAGHRYEKSAVYLMASDREALRERPNLWKNITLNTGLGSCNG